MVSRDAIQIRVEGVEASRAALENILRSMSGGIPQALAVVGEQWVTEIRRFAPLKTGRLRRSYDYEVGRGRKALYVEVGSNVIYAPYQEFGTSRISGTPHFRPGTDAVTRKVPALVAEGISRQSQGLGASIGRALPGASKLGQTVGRLGALGG